MTPEEKIRLNELCAAIEDERDYEKFAAMLREMSELLERKEQRRFPQQPKLVLARDKPWTSMSAIVTKVLASIDGPNRKVEISIPAADHLFREIRIENKLMGVDGKPVELIPGGQLTVTLEGEAASTVAPK